MIERIKEFYSDHEEGYIGANITFLYKEAA